MFFGGLAAAAAVSAMASPRLPVVHVPSSPRKLHVRLILLTFHAISTTSNGIKVGGAGGYRLLPSLRTFHTTHTAPLFLSLSLSHTHTHTTVFLCT